MRFLIQLVQRLPVPQAAFDLKLGRVTAQRDGVGGVGLDFDGIGTGSLGLFYDVEGGLQAAVMIGRHLGNDIGRVGSADGAAVDLECGFHGWFRFQVAFMGRLPF